MTGMVTKEEIRTWIEEQVKHVEEEARSKLSSATGIALGDLEARLKLLRNAASETLPQDSELMRTLLDGGLVLVNDFETYGRGEQRVQIMVGNFDVTWDKQGYCPVVKEGKYRILLIVRPV